MSSRGGSTNGGYGNYRGSDATPTVGHVFDGVSGILAGLGLGAATTQARDGLIEHVDRLATERRVSIWVHGLRYGALTLAAPPQDAALLRLDLEAIREQLNAVLKDTVDRITLRVDRGMAAT